MDEELTLVTKEVLERAENFKECTMNSMVVGDTNIVKGVTIFEEILKEINPEEIDDQVIVTIKLLINEYLLKKSSKHTNYLRYGIFICLVMLENYRKEYIFNKKYK